MSHPNHSYKIPSPPSPRETCPSCGGIKFKNSFLCKDCSLEARFGRDQDLDALWRGGSRLAFPMTEAEKDRYGVTVTFSKPDGAVLVLHERGDQPLRLLKYLVRKALATDQAYRIRTISTPQTIYTDLKNRDLGDGPPEAPYIRGAHLRGMLESQRGTAREIQL